MEVVEGYGRLWKVTPFSRIQSILVVCKLRALRRLKGNEELSLLLLTLGFALPTFAQAQDPP